MNNSHRSPDQRIEDAQTGNRLKLVPFSTFSMRRGLLALYPQLAADLAKRKAVVTASSQIVEHRVEQPAPTAAPEVPVVAAATELESAPLSEDQIGQETARQELLQTAYDKINQAFEA